MKTRLLLVTVSVCLCFSGFIQAQGLTGSEALAAKFKNMMAEGREQTTQQRASRVQP